MGMGCPYHRPTSQSATDYTTASRSQLPRLIAIDHHCSMDKKINLNSTLSRAYWSSAFCCTEKDLIEALDTTKSDEVGVVGLFLATRGRLIIGRSEEESSRLLAEHDKPSTPTARLRKAMDRSLMRR
jgi:hypothetical protein